MVRIYADSTNDLDPGYIKEHDIRIIPLYITMGNMTGRDGVDIGPDGIFRWADENKAVPKTAAFSPGDVVKALTPVKEAGEEAVFIGISEGFSSTCQAARLAASELEYEEHIAVIDSRNLSTGIGLVIMEAVRLRDRGAGIGEIKEQLASIIPRVRASFVVDTLVYLHRGGRCSSVARAFAGALNIRPKIVVEDGKMHVDKKYRGSLHGVIMKYVKDMQPELLKAEKDTVYITHSGVDKDIADEVRAYLASLSHFDNIIETRAGGIISCHCGPGTLGVLFTAG